MGFDKINQNEFVPVDFEKDKIRNFIIERAKELGPEIIQNYEDFHENPELGGEEFETAKKVSDYLKKLDIEIIGEGIGNAGERGKGAGLVAKIKGQTDGPMIALRADMDALPMSEDQDNSPKSKKEGVMHGCGHDAHTAGLMGAAKILKDLADKGELDGDALLLFQSSEEKAHQKESGAIQIIKFLEKQGLRDQIKAFMGLHVYTSLERGKVQLKEGTQLASSGEIDIKLTSPGGHIMNVYDTPSLHRIFSKLTLKLEDKFKPMNENKEALVGSARTSFEGTGYNVLPAEGKSTWVVRVTSPRYKEISSQIADEIKKAVEETIAEEPGTDFDKEKIGIEIKRMPGYRPVVHRDPNLVKIASESGKEVIDNYEQVEKILMGGEDFSFYLEKFRDKEIPGVFAMVGAANPEKGYPKINHHNTAFKIDPDVIKDLSALYSDFTVNSIKYFKEKNLSVENLSTNDK